MGIFEENKAHFAAVVGGIQYTQIEEALSGRLDSAGNFVGDPTTGVDVDYMWVRVGFNGRELVRALIGVNMVAYCHVNGKRIQVGLNNKGERVAIEPVVDQQQAAVSPGQATNPLADNTPKPYRLITGARVLPISANASPGVAVFVEASPSIGLLMDTPSFDLSADIPATSGQFGWSIVYSLNGVLGHAASTARYMPTPAFLDIPTAEAVILPVGAVRLWAVSLFNGQTDILAGNTRFEDLRWRFAPLLPLDNYTATAAPAVTDDDTEGYSFGSQWWDTTHGVIYDCLDATTGAAVWQSRASSGGSLSVTVGATTITPVTSLTFVGGALSGTTPNATYTPPSGGSLTSASAYVTTSDYAVTNGSYGDVTGLSLTLAAGTWLVNVFLECDESAFIGTIATKLYDGSSVVYGAMESSQAAGFAYSLAFTALVVLSGSTTIKVAARSNSAGGLILYATRLDVTATANLVSGMIALKIA